MGTLTQKVLPHFHRRYNWSASAFKLSTLHIYVCAVYIWLSHSSVVQSWEDVETRHRSHLCVIRFHHCCLHLTSPQQDNQHMLH